MLSFDFKLEVDCTSVYLENVTKTLRIVTEDLECEMLTAQREHLPAFPERVLELCCGFSVVIRELDRITDELKEAVVKEYQAGESE